MASWMPWRAVRNAVGTCSLGSAVSEEVSELVCRQSTPISRITSWTAKAPLDASASRMIWQLIVVDQVARHLGGFLRCALGIAHHQLDLAAVDAARLVERIEHRAHAADAGLADQGDAARLDGRHADLDGAALALDDRRHADDARGRRGAGGLQHATTTDRPRLECCHAFLPLVAPASARRHFHTDPDLRPVGGKSMDNGSARSNEPGA